jgi:hypothetical protein
MKYPCSIEQYYGRALEQLGHKIFIDRFEEDFNYPVDLSIVVKWCRHPYSLGHPSVLIFTDLTTRFQEYYYSIQKFFDYIFLVHNEPLVDNKRIFYLPVAYDPAEHYYVESKKDIDCLFIGTNHPCRSFLKNIQLITRYGNEWGDTCDVYGGEFRVLCSRAKIIVNQHYPGDTTNMRDYEAMNFHVVILTDKTPFSIGTILYENKENLEMKIQYFLEHEDERQQMAEQAYKTITTGKYTYKDRMEEMLRIINETKL